MAALLALCVLLSSPSLAGSDMEPRMDGIVRVYRDAIVLGASAPNLPEGQRRDVPVLGKMLFEDRREMLSSLRSDLVADVPDDSRDKAKVLSEFLTVLERDPDLHDGDKLAFLDLLMTLRGKLEAAPSGKRRDALLTRVSEDEAAIREIEAAYREEMREVFGQLRTRGMTLSREAWDEYLQEVQSERPVQTIFAEYADEVSVNMPGTRGWKDNPLELYGTSLPDKTFVITFDDGPSEEYTAQILDTLKEHGVKGVFFQVGENVGAYGEDGALVETPASVYTKRLLREGHMIGSHSWSHKNLPKMSDAQLKIQLDRADQVLEAVSETDVVLFRPPYGGRDGRVLKALTDRDTKAYLWNVDSMDWADPIPESIAQTVYEQVSEVGHGVILLHDVHHQTAEALPIILEKLAEEGYQLVLWDGETIFGKRGEDVAAKADPEPTGLYANSWAVVIGINKYEQWPRLAYAVHDAEGVRDKLIDDFNFDPDKVISLFDRDATRQRILEVLGDELPNKLEADDRVFVFYAGHGTTRAMPGGSERGYIIPVDADTEHLQGRAISMSVLADINEAMAAKHVLYVIDACYSGIALTRAGSYSGDPRRYMREVTRRNARQILTAGGADEQVADHGPSGHSIFTWTVLQGMDGPADLNGDGFITASELSSFVAPRVSSLSKQTPAFGNLVGSAGGEFVFALDRSSALLSDLSSSKTGDAELERAKGMLEAENAELLAELKKMQDEMAAIKGNRGGETPEEEAERLHTLGLEMYREGKLAEAYEAIRQASELDGTNVEIVNNHGFLLQELGAWEKALPWLERTIELDADRAVAYLNLGDTYRALDRREESVEAYEKYLEMVPDSRARRRIEGWLQE